MDDLIALDDRLRMVATDVPALTAAVAEWRASDDPKTQRRLGIGLIALGNYSEAVVVLDRVVRDAVSNADSQTEVKARINLGDAFRYHGDLRAAFTEYQRAVSQARASALETLDFALQHLGKYYLDAGRRGDAISCFWEALRLRKAKGDQSLIDSTLSALSIAGELELPSAHGVV
jgi:tetratricopeptide (TPR) repeat protein